MKGKRLILIVLFSVLLLLIPLALMLFTDSVNWALSDFVIAGILLLGAGLLCELILRKVKNKNYRVVGFVTLLIVLLLIFVELAVGIFGTPFSGH